jgi:hypothetical protein
MQRFVVGTVLASGLVFAGITVSGSAYAKHQPIPELVAQASRDRAPLATYTAVAKGRGAFRPDRTTEGVQVTINLSSYSTQEELKTIANAGAGNITAALSRYNHGTITIGGRIYPINLAYSYQQGSNYRINLISGKPFAASGPQGGTATTNAYGAITLLLPIAPNTLGTGTLSTVMGSRISLQGDIVGGVGRAASTPLSDVAFR